MKYMKKLTAEEKRAFKEMIGPSNICSMSDISDTMRNFPRRGSSMKVIEKFCLKYDDGTGYVALDSSSGGYPYAVAIEQAHDFKSEEAARKYPSSSERFTFCRIRFTIEEV